MCAATGFVAVLPAVRELVADADPDAARYARKARRTAPLSAF